MGWQELATTNEALNLTAQLFACQAFIKFTVLLDQQLGVNYGLSLGQWACPAGVAGTLAAAAAVAGGVAEGRQGVWHALTEIRLRCLPLTSGGCTANRAAAATAAQDSLPVI